MLYFPCNGLSNHNGPQHQDPHYWLLAGGPVMSEVVVQTFCNQFVSGCETSVKELQYLHMCNLNVKTFA